MHVQHISTALWLIIMHALLLCRPFCSAATDNATEAPAPFFPAVRKFFASICPSVTRNAIRNTSRRGP